MLLIVLKLLAKLPLPLLRALGSVIGVCVYYLSSKTRAVVKQNLLQAQLSINPREVVKANVRGLFDMVWVWFSPASVVAAHCCVHAAVPEQIVQGTAKILLTPHLGCFEALAKWFSADAPLTAMYRRPNKPWLAALVQAVRQTPHLTMAPADAGGVRIALKTLKTGGALGILPDQAPRQGEGIWLPWFGRDAYTITLPAKLHLSTGAPMVIFAALPIKNGWQIVCDPVNAPAGLNAEQLTLHLNQALERIVLRDPLHYAWSYKRYKGSQA